MEEGYTLDLNLCLNILLNNMLTLQKLYLSQPTTELTIWRIFGQMPNKHMKSSKMLLIKESKKTSKSQNRNTSLARLLVYPNRRTFEEACAKMIRTL